MSSGNNPYSSGGNNPYSAGAGAQFPASGGSLPPQGIPLPNYLVQSILVTLCCCIPFGIVAIVFASQVNGKIAAGDHAGAKSSSDKAKLWCWISFGSGILISIISFVIQVVAAVSVQQPNNLGGM
ncbi:MAG: CD225/dispanin family protein [Pirellulaceae bacterium]|nr:CD225/dispanin family protein [Pirellulaceae bacterium]